MNNHRQKTRGFTLIEILIALSIFAVMSLIISSVLYTVFQARDRVNLQADRLWQLQYTLIVMQRDIEQAIMRPITDENNTTLPALFGDESRFEFTRAGYINPLYQEQRSSLQRVAYQASNEKINRQTWPSLDRTSATPSSARNLTDQLSKIRFAYLDEKNNLQSRWSSQEKNFLPKAIQINFKTNDWGELSLLFAIPGGGQTLEAKKP